MSVIGIFSLARIYFETIVSLYNNDASCSIGQFNNQILTVAAIAACVFFPLFVIYHNLLLIRSHLVDSNLAMQEFVSGQV
jgi:hypothetical protein